jgi:hypothetical protein
MVKEMFADAPKPAAAAQQASKPAEPTKQASKPAPVDPAIAAKMLVAEGRKVYQSGRELTQDEVRRMMANTDAIRLYNKGIKRNRNGNAWLFTGLGMLAGGVLILATEPFETKYTYTSNGNEYYDYESGMSYYIGGPMLAAGVAMSATGLIMKAASRSPVKNSVNMYNSGLRSKTSAELRFGFTQNGVSLALNF